VRLGISGAGRFEEVGTGEPSKDSASDRPEARRPAAVLLGIAGLAAA
jgi:hypothetical protein